MNKNMTFESAMVKLEEIINKLESGNESLENSLKLFEEGSALASLCYGKLQSAEQKIKQISELEGTDGDKNV
ncbi:MAG TPA: exodeoxyribonuclease VII small subunit [Caproiciproducens sp.]|jgi:exodeoxyribonuclease VII, small subunit|nr:exodeoxyribonuclease VII small subunit [Caproiciproducens sp.]